MAASAGTNPGSTTDGVAVGVGDGDSLADDVADGEAGGEGEAGGGGGGGGRAGAGGAGFRATVGVHPPRTIAIVTRERARTIRRSGVTAPMPIGRDGCLRACTSAGPVKSC